MTHKEKKRKKQMNNLHNELIFDETHHALSHVQNTCPSNPLGTDAFTKREALKLMDSFGMWWKSYEIIFLHWIIIW